ncbi:MAG: hypothetical protein DRJ44_02075 [Thermoprotei archaeon]|nr:MAG: hypothetical protein DRJ44_02075 [Thermoprotei archaeon]
MFEYALIMVAGFLTTYITTPIVAKIAREKNLVRPDVHKPGEPMVPTLGGLAIYFGLIVSILLTTILYPEYLIQITVVASTATILLIIGLIDDIVILKGRVKTILTVLAITPTVTAGFLYPRETGLWIKYRPLVPLVGALRLTIIYWLLMPLAIAGPANAMNMFDIFNGSMVITSLIASIALFSSAILLDNNMALVLLTTLLGPLLGFLPYNKYPSRIFAGDCGGLLVGGIIGVIAILSKMEFIALVALMPQILNAFYIVSSIKGFIEHRKIRNKPTVLLPDYKMRASKDPNAPITLTRLILLLGGDADENELIKAFTYIQIFSAFLAVISALLLKVKI